MKKSEVIKLMKEGTHCIYNDCPEKEELLRELCKIPQEVDVIEFSHYQLPPLTFTLGRKEKINLSEIEPDNKKPYLYFEGDKYYFGEEYEFRDCESEDWVKCTLILFDTTKKNPFNWVHIRKIDHTTKYKKLLLELKEQAEKDGVNLKELI